MKAPGHALPMSAHMVTSVQQFLSTEAPLAGTCFSPRGGGGGGQTSSAFHAEQDPKTLSDLHGWRIISGHTISFARSPARPPIHPPLHASGKCDIPASPRPSCSCVDVGI